MHGLDGCADLRVGEGEEPAYAALRTFREIKAQGLDEHHVGEVLDDEEAAGAGIAELLAHAFEGPAHGGFVGFMADVRDGGEDIEQDAGVAAGEGEVAADDAALSSAVDDGEATIGELWFAGEEGPEVGGRRGKVRGEAERAAMGKQEAVAGGEADGGRDAFHDEPALAGNDGVALDAVMAGELNGEFSADVKAAGDVGVGL